MIDQLPKTPIPDWLKNTEDEVAMRANPFPIRNLLFDSLYYPSSGFDGDPLMHICGNILSFVYVGYGRTRDDFIRELRDPGFRGYDLLGYREETRPELMPFYFHPMPLNPEVDDSNQYPESPEKPFYTWSVFKLNENLKHLGGTSRFSLL